MSQLWRTIRFPVALVAIFAVTILLARVFSGPEDHWALNEQGEWVMHGHPAGPPPDFATAPTHFHLIIPLAFFVAFIAPLALMRFHKPISRLSYDSVAADLRWLGYLGTVLLLFGGFTGVGLMVEVVMAPSSNAPFGTQDLMILSGLALGAVLAILFGAGSLALERVVNDNYQIARAVRDLGEQLRPPRSAPESIVV